MPSLIAHVNFRLISEGICWQCRGPLERILDFGECFTCGRRFTVRGRTITEQITVPDDIKGKSVWLGVDAIQLVGGKVRRLTGEADGMVEVPVDAEWFVTSWDI